MRPVHAALRAHSRLNPVSWSRASPSIGTARPAESPSISRARPVIDLLAKLVPQPSAFDPCAYGAGMEVRPARFARLLRQREDMPPPPKREADDVRAPTGRSAQ
jgi:hypothetical protein